MRHISAAGQKEFYLLMQIQLSSRGTGGRFGTVRLRARLSTIGSDMKKFTTSLLAASFAVSASTAFAGGPVVIEEEGQPEVIAEKPASSVGILPLLLIPIILCVALCGGDDDEVVEEEETSTN
jgi:hypothetical protein